VALIACLDVEPAGAGDERLWGWYLDYPARGSVAEAAALEIRGWVVGRHAPAVAVEILHEGHVLRRVPIDVRRDDVAAVHAQAPAAAVSGFATIVRMRPGAARRLDVRTVLSDQQRVPLATLHLETRWREDEQGGTPLVSVIIPCFRQAQYLGDAIESVLAQTYPHVEIVVVDDGSPDNTAEVAARYPGVRCIRPSNGGVSAARNLGIQSSTGSFLIFLDADDWLLPRAVEDGLACLARHPEAAFVSGRFRFVAADGATLYGRQGHGVEHHHYAEMLRRNYVAALCTVMFRRSVFETVSGFSPAFSVCADYDLYLRVLRDFPAACHDAEVAAYRRHGLGISTHVDQLLREALAALEAQRPALRGDPQLIAAYRSGRRFWKVVAADTIARQVRADWQNGRRRSAIHGFLRLRRCGWAGLAPLRQRGYSGVGA
jgi:glycosyltransferase involved in cell wall biosynthesis